MQCSEGGLECAEVQGEGDEGKGVSDVAEEQIDGVSGPRCFRSADGSARV